VQQKRYQAAGVANDYFQGNARKAEREMGWGRGTIETGLG